MFHALPDPGWFELDERPVRGRDLTLLRQWAGLTVADCSYLLGLTVPRFHLAQNRPDDLLEDPAVALLVWALLRFPEAHFVPPFPDPAEVYPEYARALAHSGIGWPDPEGAFGVLLGQSRPAAARWLSGMGSPRQTLHPPLRRLLLAFRRFLAARGVAGLDAFVDRARQEAEARGLRLDSPALTTWARRRRRARAAPDPDPDDRAAEAPGPDDRMPRRRPGRPTSGGAGKGRPRAKGRRPPKTPPA